MSFVHHYIPWERWFLYFHCIKVNGDLERVNDVTELLNILWSWDRNLNVIERLCFPSTLVCDPVNWKWYQMFPLYLWEKTFTKKVSNLSTRSEGSIFLSFQSWAEKITKEGHNVTSKKAVLQLFETWIYVKGTADIGMSQVHPVELSSSGKGYKCIVQSLRDNIYPKAIYDVIH